MVDYFMATVGWKFCSTHHIILGTTPGAATFGRDILFGWHYIADWSEITRRTQHQVDPSDIIGNRNQIAFDYIIGTELVYARDGIYRKSEDRKIDPYLSFFTPHEKLKRVDGP